MDEGTLKKISHAFTKELEDAQNGQKTSLPFIIHQLSESPIAKPNETFQVLKIGGSIMQNALVHTTKTGLVIDAVEEEHLPVFTTGKAFLAFVKAHLRKNVRILALNFAYPLNPVFENGKLDGILINGTKEHTFTGLVGKQVGASVEQYIEKTFRKYVGTTLANDTICLVLAGLTKYSKDNLAGGIVGTGMNFAFFLDDTHVVNLEAGNFNKFDQSKEGIMIDKESQTKGRQWFEKEVTGGYLYQHYNLRLAAVKSPYPAIESTHGLDRVARGELRGNKKLAQELLSRSAQLIACQIAGIIRFKKRDMTFVMEGSLFWIGYNYRRTVEETIRLLEPSYTVTFDEIKDCGILGAAKLVT